MNKKTIFVTLILSALLFACQKQNIQKNSNETTNSTPNTNVLKSGNYNLIYTTWNDKALMYLTEKGEAVFYLQIQGGGDVHELEEISFTLKSTDGTASFEKATWSKIEVTPQDIKAHRFPGDGRFMKCLISKLKIPTQTNTFSLTISGASADGKEVIPPVNLPFVLVNNDPKDNFVEFEISKNADSSSFDVSSIMKNINSSDFDYVEVKAIYTNSKGLNTTSSVLTEMRKKVVDIGRINGVCWALSNTSNENPIPDLIATRGIVNNVVFDDFVEDVLAEEAKISGTTQDPNVNNTFEFPFTIMLTAKDKQDKILGNTKAYRCIVIGSKVKEKGVRFYRSL